MTVLVEWLGKAPPPPLEWETVLMPAEHEDLEALAAGIVTDNRIVLRLGAGALTQKTVFSRLPGGAWLAITQQSKWRSSSSERVPGHEALAWARAFLARRRVFRDVDEKASFRAAWREVAWALSRVRDGKAAS